VLLTYRWVRVRDQSSTSSLAVKWYTNGRDDVLRSLQVGMVRTMFVSLHFGMTRCAAQCVGLTDLKVMRLTSADARVPPVVFCKSTYQSQLLDVTRFAGATVSETVEWGAQKRLLCARVANRACSTIDGRGALAGSAGAASLAPRRVHTRAARLSAAGVRAACAACWH
jgi:hypothetical protein